MPRIRSTIGAISHFAIVAFLFLGSARGAVAEDNALKPLDRPDPSSVTVPDLNFTPAGSDVDDYDEYYYFYRPDVSYERAFADLDECRMYTLESQLSILPPKFVPLSSNAIVIKRRLMPNLFTQYGVVGAVLGAIVLQHEEEDNARATEKRCMAYKGYSRYGTTSAIWTQINSGTEEQKIARMALIASGPKPQAKAIDP